MKLHETLLTYLLTIITERESYRWICLCPMVVNL